MNWQELSSIEELELIVGKSDSILALFKHSTRCSISAVAKKRIEMGWEKHNPETPIYYIDLIKNRPLSNYITERFKVEHESPQLILLKDGKSIYSATHLSINPKSISKYS